MRQYIDYLPLFLRQIKDFVALGVSADAEALLSQGQLDQLQANRLVMTADEGTVTRWERVLGIFATGDEVLDFRRARVQSRLAIGLPYTLAQLQASLTLLLGHDQYVLRLFYGEFCIKVAVAWRQHHMLHELLRLKHAMIPANLLFDIELEYGTRIEARSEYIGGLYNYPLCNLLVAGVWPVGTRTGHLLQTTCTHESTHTMGSFGYPLTGSIVAANQTFRLSAFVLYNGHSSVMDIRTEFKGDMHLYPLCNQVRAGEHPR